MRGVDGMTMKYLVHNLLSVLFVQERREREACEMQRQEAIRASIEPYATYKPYSSSDSNSSSSDGGRRKKKDKKAKKERRKEKKKKQKHKKARRDKE